MVSLNARQEIIDCSFTLLITQYCLANILLYTMLCYSLICVVRTAGVKNRELFQSLLTTVQLQL